MNKYYVRHENTRVLYYLAETTVYGIYVDKTDTWEDLLVKKAFQDYVDAYNYCMEQEPVDLKWAKLRGIPACQ